MTLLLHIRAGVDLDQDAAWRATKESRSARVVEDHRFHANATFDEFLIEGMNVVEAPDLKAELEVRGPDRRFAGDVVQNDVETIPFERADLPSGDDLAARLK